MSDIVERLRTPSDMWPAVCEEAADEIERLLELLRGVGANRYWEERWRDAEAGIERLERGIRSVHDYVLADRIGDALHDCDALLAGGKYEVRHDEQKA